MKRDKDFGGFLGEWYDLAGDNIAPIVIFIAVVGGANAIGLILGMIDPDNTLASFGIGFMVDATDDIVTVLYSIGVAVLSVVASYFLLARLLESRRMLPDRATRIWAYVGLTILTTLGAIFGLLLLIVPGIILLVRWVAAPGYLIGARTGIVEAMQQSWHATRGYSWPIFGAGLVLIICLIALAFAFGAIAGLTTLNPVIASVSGIFDAIGSVVSLVYTIAVYRLLHDDSQELAEAFD